MYTKHDLNEQLHSLGIKHTDSLLVHSSMKAIGQVEGGADAVLDVFIEYLSPRGNIIMPTHTWEQINDEYNIFDPLTEPSCVGLLSEMFRKRQGVLRSLHPTHSVGVMGVKAEWLVANEREVDTPCPRNGCWGKLLDLNAKILFLGASPKCNTFIHGVEEWLNVPDRIADSYSDMKIRLPESRELYDRPMRRHKCSTGDVSKNYDRIVPYLDAHGLITRGKFGDANCIVMDTPYLTKVVMERLRLDPDFFGNHDNTTEQ